YRNTIQGNVLECNDALARILGYESREELMRHNAVELYAQAGDRQLFIDRLREMRSLFAEEVTLRRKDGRMVHCVESVHLLEAELFEGTVIAISSRKAAEDALRQSEGRYRQLVERMREGLAQVGTDGILQFCNDQFCDMLGYRRDELVGFAVGRL